MIRNKYDEQVKLGDNIIINIQDLPKNSHVLVDVKCDVCGKEKVLSYKEYNRSISNQNFYACSSKCSVEKNKITNLEKYGVEHISQSINIKNKKKENNLDKYGVEYISQLENVKEKIKKTKNEKYGDEKYNNREKYFNTCLEKYNNKIFVKSDYFKENVKYKSYYKQSFLDKIKEKYLLKFNINILDYIDGYFICVCEKSHTYKIRPDMLLKRLTKYKTEPCTICNTTILNSEVEKELLIFIKENYNGEIITSDRKILNGKELDIYLPELKLAFEFNGIYWHSELYKNKYYHKNKSDLCEEKGIQLFHVWEDDWKYKQNIVKSMILNKLYKTKNRIYARNCEIKEITDNKLIRNFLDENHIQGFVGSSIKIGLYYNNELVSLMTFKKRKDKIYELNRFCNKINTNIVGGASKLFNYIKKQFKEIISFADRSYSDGKLYEILKFNKKTHLNISYWYLIEDRKVHKFNFRKEEKNKEKLIKIFEPGKIKYIWYNN
ncbi:MAG: hypothetical protein M0R46_13910 [Candidatus Muirbacterium halophilum]|nr:hypothetical protein [Candidatus Muirbacterium halophilum]